MEAIVFFVSAGTTLVIATQRIKNSKAYDSESAKYGSMFGTFVESNNMNNLNSFVRRPNRETALLSCENPGIFTPEFREANNRMKLNAKINNPKGLMDPLHVQGKQRSPYVISRMHGKEEDQIKINKWAR